MGDDSWRGRPVGCEIELVGIEVVRTARIFTNKMTSASTAGLDEWHESLQDAADRCCSQPWMVKGDGSLPHPSAEAASPVLFMDRQCCRESLHEVMTVLRREGARYPQSTGLHVHVDVTDLDATGVRRVLTHYGRLQPLLRSFISRCRLSREASYCRSANREDLRRFAPWAAGRARQESQYGYGHAVYNKIMTYGTLEFRQHHGTASPQRIIQWMEFLIDFVNQAQHIPIPSRGEDIIDLISNHPLSTVEQVHRELNMTVPTPTPTTTR